MLASHFIHHFCPLLIFNSWKLFESSFLLCLTIVLKSYSGRGYHSIPLRKIQQLEERANAEENNPRAQAEYLKVRLAVFFLLHNTNLLLTEREGRTGEYWPEVVTVRTEHSEVRTKTTEGKYSPVRLEQAGLVSSLLYGTLFLIVKCTFGGLHLKMFVFSTHLWNFGKNFNLFSFCW